MRRSRQKVRSKGAPGGVSRARRSAAICWNSAPPWAAQISQSFRAECGVDLDAGDPALRSDAVCHQPHYRAWP
jgi:hypothetical protein